MVVYEKIYLEAYINNLYIWLKNNTAQYFLLGWDQASKSKDSCDIPSRSSSWYINSRPPPFALLEIYEYQGESPSKLKKFKQMYCLFMYTSAYIFS